MSNSLIVHEIFTTIQGESTDTGLPCTFVRLYGCNVGCSFCDQPQHKKDCKRMTIEALVSEVKKLHIPYVCITGGEPLMQWDNVYPVVLELVHSGFLVSIETSGCFPIESCNYNRSYKYIMDIKCPSSGVSHRNIYDNMMNLQMKDEVKFVIGNREDYDFAKKVLMQYPTSAKILFSPCFDENWKPLISEDLVKWMIEDELWNVRVQIQIHKVLGVR
jgi:7-carboxy-7-deazaguanine synthase